MWKRRAKMQKRKTLEINNFSTRREVYIMIKQTLIWHVLNLFPFLSEPVVDPGLGVDCARPSLIEKNTRYNINLSQFHCA